MPATKVVITEFALKWANSGPNGIPSEAAG